MDKTCGNCRFWLQQRDMDGELVNEGLCHRYPLWGFARFQKLPDVSKKSKLKYEYKVENFVGQWQNRHSSDWCGEWEQKDG